MNKPLTQTVIRIFDDPCGSGKSRRLIKEMQQAKYEKQDIKLMIVVPYLTEIERFQNEVGSDFIFAPITGDGAKIDQLIEALELGKNIITTHALFEEIRKFRHLLSEYHVFIDEVPTTTKQVPVFFGSVGFKDLIEDRYILVDLVTGLLSITQDGLDAIKIYGDGDPKDKEIAKFLYKVAFTEVYKISGTYCLMPIPDCLFTEPKSLTILTFLFKGTQLNYYMKMKGYEYQLYSDHMELESFKWDMFENINFYERTSTADTGFNALNKRPAKNRKTVGNFIVKAMKELRSTHKIEQSNILVASHKDAWFGKDKSHSSKVTNETCLSKLCKLTKSDYTPLITRGTNKFSDKSVLLVLGTENLNPNIARFLGINTKDAHSRHQLSEIVQLIYRTRIRRGESITLVCVDPYIKKLLKDFIGFDKKQKLLCSAATRVAIQKIKSDCVDLTFWGRPSPPPYKIRTNRYTPVKEIV